MGHRVVRSRRHQVGAGPPPGPPGPPEGGEALERQHGREHLAFRGHRGQHDRRSPCQRRRVCRRPPHVGVEPRPERHRAGVEPCEHEGGSDRGQDVGGHRQQHGAGQAPQGHRHRDVPLRRPQLGHDDRREGDEQQEQAERSPFARLEQLPDAQRDHRAPARHRSGQEQPAPPAAEDDLDRADDSDGDPGGGDETPAAGGGDRPGQGCARDRARDEGGELPRPQQRRERPAQPGRDQAGSGGDHQRRGRPAAGLPAGPRARPRRRRHRPATRAPS